MNAINTHPPMVPPMIAPNGSPFLPDESPTTSPVAELSTADGVPLAKTVFDDEVSGEADNADDTDEGELDGGASSASMLSGY
jgi:hypothetical protein